MRLIPPPLDTVARGPLVVAPPNTRPMPGHVPGIDLWRRPAVGRSPELDRVLALPTRPRPSDHALDYLVAAETDRHTRPRAPGSCACRAMGRPCITRLTPAQAWALSEIAEVGGLLGPIGVGMGKTGLDILAPMAVPNCRLAVLLIPPGLRAQLVADYQAWAEHFMVPSLSSTEASFVKPGRPVLHVLPYSRLCRAKATAMLEYLRPDTIIADEAHKLKNFETSTTSRVMRYLADHPEVRLLSWSGTLTSKSIKDYWHLSAHSLGEGSPLPINRDVVEEWSTAIDPSDTPAPMGELARLCRPGEHVYDGFHRRLVETRGVVATTGQGCQAEINLIERHPGKVPTEVARLLEQVRVSWMRPDGEEFINVIQVKACLRQLACGYYYRWIYPRGEVPEVIAEWFAARKAWHQELREKLKARRVHLDSPFLCAKAAIRAYQQPPYHGDLPVWKAETWKRWRDVRTTVHPETEAVWIDEWVARDAAAWAKSHRGIVWYEHAALGARIAALSDLPMHAGGVGAEGRILAEDGSRSLIVSIAAHGTGRDGLQRLFREQIVAEPPQGGQEWEQLLGRLHRIKQEADEVDVYVYRHTIEMKEGIDKAVEQAKYVQGTMGSSQKLLIANVQFR